MLEELKELKGHPRGIPELREQQELREPLEHKVLFRVIWELKEPLELRVPQEHRVFPRVISVHKVPQAHKVPLGLKEE